MTLFATLIPAILLCMQAGIGFRLQEQFFAHRMNRCIAFASGIFLYLAGGLTGSYYLGRQGYYFLYSILQQGIFILLLILFFRGNLWNRASMASVFCASYVFILNGVIETASLLGMFLPAGWQSWTDFLLNLSCLGAALIPWYAFRRIRLRPDIYSVQACQLLFFVMCGLMLLTDIVYHGITHGVIMISYTGHPEVFNLYISELLTHAECIILSVLSLAMALGLPAGLNRIIRQSVSEQLLNTQITHYQALLEEHKKQTDLRHDLKNHLLVLSRLTDQGESEQISAYLKAMHQEAYTPSGNICTGNIIADAVIDIKEQAARARNISFTCELALSGQLPLEDFDLCVVLGNLLDNAIKAAGQIPDAEKRSVILQAKSVKRNLLLEIKNTAADTARLKQFDIADYGTGLHNVRNIVEKNNGVMEITFADPFFCVSVLVPCKA